MIGDKVKLTKVSAKWMLEHLDFCYDGKGDPDPDFDAYVYLSLLTLMDGEAAGKITGYGAYPYVFSVEFKTPFGKHWAYYEYPKDIQRL